MDGDVFSAAVLEKLPLADSVWRLLHFTMDDSWLEDLWARQRGRCYERDLKFSTLAHLIADALLEHSGSGNQAFERSQEAEVLPVSITSAYDKLGNLPLAVSETLLEEGTQRMNAVLPEIPAVDPLPDCWRITKSSAPTARRSSMSNDCLSRCAVCGRAFLGRVRRWAEPADGSGGGDGRPSRRRSR